MNAITKTQDTLPGIPAEAPSMLELVMRAVRDPACDPSKMMQLVEISRQIRADEAAQAYSAAMVAAQKEMDPVRTDCANDQTSSRYASYAALDTAIRPTYSKHGFAISYDTADGAPVDYVRVLANVMHESGHTKVHHFDIPADGKGAKGGNVMTKTHAAGSAFTYGKRYLLGGIFNIVVSDNTDDDGNAASASDLITDEQIEEIFDMLKQCRGDTALFCKYMKVDSVPDIRQKDMGKAREALNENISAYQRAHPKGQR